MDSVSYIHIGVSVSCIQEQQDSLFIITDNLIALTKSLDLHHDNNCFTNTSHTSQGLYYIGGHPEISHTLLAPPKHCQYYSNKYKINQILQN